MLKSFFWHNLQGGLEIAQNVISVWETGDHHNRFR
jgi:hypothetical protein